MKKIIYTILSITMLTACKKDTTNISPVQTSNEKLKKMKYYVSEGNDTIFLYYNTSNKVEKLVNTQKKNYYFLFTYDQDGFYVDEYVNSVKNKTIYYCLLNDDKKSKVVYGNDTLNFYYDGNNLTSLTSRKYSGSYKYFWLNGNITKQVINDKYGVGTLYYEYLENKNFGFWKVSNLGKETYLYGYENYVGIPIGLENTNLVNLVKNSKGQIVFDFDYEFDNDGYVIKRLQKVYIYDNSGKQIDQYDRINYFGWY